MYGTFDMFDMEVVEEIEETGLVRYGMCIIRTRPQHGIPSFTSEPDAPLDSNSSSKVYGRLLVIQGPTALAKGRGTRFQHCTSAENFGLFGLTSGTLPSPPA